MSNFHPLHIIADATLIAKPPSEVRRRKDDQAIAVGQVVQAGQVDRRQNGESHHHRHGHRI